MSPATLCLMCDRPASFLQGAPLCDPADAWLCRKEFLKLVGYYEMGM